MKLVAFTDGGNRAEVGACAAILIRESGEFEIYSKLLGVVTNNVAEYNGALLSLTAAKEMGAEHLEIFSDSQLIVRQVNLEYSIKDRNLRYLAEDFWRKSAQFESVSISWVPREKNKKADLVCRKLMDNYKLNPFLSQT